MDVWMDVSKYMHECLHVYRCMHECMDEFVRIYPCICLHACTWNSIHIAHTRARARTPCPLTHTHTNQQKMAHGDIRTERKTKTGFQKLNAHELDVQSNIISIIPPILTPFSRIPCCLVCSRSRGRVGEQQQLHQCLYLRILKRGRASERRG